MATFLSKSGKDLLGKRIELALRELDDIRKEKEIAYTASGDTWHDNPGFNALEQAEHRKVVEIRELQTIFSTGEVKNIEPRPINFVDIGSIVKYLQIVDNTGEEIYGVFEIVGYGESDPNSKKIAYDSPVGSVLFGLKIGECKDEGIYIPIKKSICFFEVIKLFSSWDDVID